MSIGYDETMLEAKRFLHLQRKSTPLARAEVTRHGSLRPETKIRVLTGLIHTVHYILSILL